MHMIHIIHLIMFMLKLCVLLFCFTYCILMKVYYNYVIGKVSQWLSSQNFLKRMFSKKYVWFNYFNLNIYRHLWVQDGTDYSSRKAEAVACPNKLWSWKESKISGEGTPEMERKGRDRERKINQWANSKTTAGKA